MTDEDWPNLANASRRRLYDLCVRAGVKMDDKWLSATACEAIETILVKYSALMKVVEFEANTVMELTRRLNENRGVAS